MIGTVGAGLIGCGCFTADPVSGFPPGAVASGISWHAVLHLIISSLSFLALVVGCVVFTRRDLSQRSIGWVIYTAISGVAALITFIVMISGRQWIGQVSVTGAFVFAMLNAYLWCSLMAARLLAEPSRASV